MSDPISTAILSVKTAANIAKVIRQSGVALEKAEVKGKLAELVSALADVQMELAEVQAASLAKDARIAELDAAFEAKDELRRVNDAMYVVDASGAPQGVALCVRCWEVDHRRRSLVVSQGGRGRNCPTCETNYDGRLTNTFGDSGVDI